jgi:phage tail sheath protein FI
MPNYYRPDTYFEESLRPISDLTSDPAEAGAAFVGKARGGPQGPVEVTSWAQYQALFGSVTYETNEMSYAVFNYFANGGRGAYIVRAYSSDATAATLMLYDGTGSLTTDETFRVTAQAPGTWASDANSASRVFVTVRAGAANRFDLVIDVGNSAYLAATEQWTDLSMDPADPRYAPDIVNSPTVGSKYVNITRSTNIVANAAPGAVTKTPLTGGSEGVAAVDLTAATQLLGQINKSLVVNVPGVTAAELSPIVTWAEGTGKHFIVADVPKPAAAETDAQSVTAMTTYAGALPVSSVVAVYGPWYYASDPGSTAGAMRLTAPGGAVVAQILRTDATRGVHKAPAGVATALNGALQPYRLYTNTQQDTLAQANVNVIKPVPGTGVVIWGARTKAVGTSDRYVPVRRLLIALKASLTNLTRFAAFENNDEDLRLTVEETVRRFLQTQYDLGALKGTTPEAAFFVRCDSTNNPTAVEESGTLIIEVGVALKTPAEFILIRIGQQEAGTSAADSLEEI